MTFKFSMSVMIASKARMRLADAGADAITATIVQPKDWLHNPAAGALDSVELVEFTMPDGSRCPWFVEVDDRGASVNERHRDRDGQLRVLQGRYFLADNYKDLIPELTSRILTHKLDLEPSLAPTL